MGKDGSGFEKGRMLQCRKMHRWMVVLREGVARAWPGGSVRAGIGDAGQASPLGGGRFWPPVR